MSENEIVIPKFRIFEKGDTIVIKPELNDVSSKFVSISNKFAGLSVSGEVAPEGNLLQMYLRVESDDNSFKRYPLYQISMLQNEVAQYVQKVDDQFTTDFETQYLEHDSTVSYAPKSDLIIAEMKNSKTRDFVDQINKPKNKFDAMKQKALPYVKQLFTLKGLLYAFFLMLLAFAAKAMFFAPSSAELSAEAQQKVLLGEMKEDKASVAAQVELTKETLKQMGLDPGKSGDVGCLAAPE